MSDYKVFEYRAPFTLESGSSLPGFHLAYHTYGTRQAQPGNVIWIFHALTANSDAADWWSGLVGEGKLFDPSRHFIVCVNMPGSCYGSVGPLERNQAVKNGITTRFRCSPSAIWYVCTRSCAVSWALSRSISVLAGQWAGNSY
ncbi:alpha/beta fold hydrolase [Paraflavitalea speifideaquila]|uniref:alpha/beta fold hydrolase n=1 Tax=Paraflavitalea speifideaquila TaxID=3076558 RepID=UPI0028E61E91|nr:alpha/beta fold hydrolase [Paraflavitalea speifideiaquila]